MRIHDRHARGGRNIGWLDAQHTFSFGDFHDPSRMGVGNLRVLNEDRIIPGGGFATHPHRDMEIITYVISGELEHKDSLGNGSIIRPGEIQRMSAGSGIRHSEKNPSATDPLHLLQIWIFPDVKGVEPGYEQKTILPDAGRNGFTLIASREGGDGAVSLNQDAKMFVAKPMQDEKLQVSGTENHAGFMQIVKGQVEIDGETLNAGDGFEFEGKRAFDINALTDSEIILFDV